MSYAITSDYELTTTDRSGEESSSAALHLVETGLAAHERSTPPTATLLLGALAAGMTIAGVALLAKALGKPAEDVLELAESLSAHLNKQSQTREAFAHHAVSSPSCQEVIAQASQHGMWPAAHDVLVLIKEALLASEGVTSTAPPAFCVEEEDGEWRLHVSVPVTGEVHPVHMAYMRLTQSVVKHLNASQRQKLTLSFDVS